MWFAGLRGPVAYALAKKWREESDNESFRHIVDTTMILVVVTTFFCGGSFAALIQCLRMEENAEEKTGTPLLKVGYHKSITFVKGDIGSKRKWRAAEQRNLPPTTQAYDYITQTHSVNIPSEHTSFSSAWKRWDVIIKRYLGGKSPAQKKTADLEADLEADEGTDDPAHEGMDSHSLAMVTMQPEPAEKGASIFD